MKKDLLAINDLEPKEILEILSLAEDMKKDRAKYAGALEDLMSGPVNLRDAFRTQHLKFHFRLRLVGLRSARRTFASRRTCTPTSYSTSGGSAGDVASSCPGTGGGVDRRRPCHNSELCCFL